MGRGLGHGSQAGTSGTQRHVYAVTPQIKLVDQSVIQGTFLLFRLWARVLFDSGASHSLIVASCMKDLGSEVENLEDLLYVNYPLGTRVSFDLICRNCELEISWILLTVERVLDMSEFDVILVMEWLKAHRVVIDCDGRRATTYTLDDNCVTFQGDKHDALPQSVYDSKWQGQLVGWMASLTLEDEVKRDLDLTRVICEYEDVFLDELPRLPPYRDVDFVIGLHPSTSPISMPPHRMALAEL